MKRLRLTWFWHHKRIVAFVLVVLAIGWAVHMLAAPVHGKTVAIDQKIGLQTVPKARPTPPASQDDQAYFSLSLPPGYQVQASQNPGGTQLYSQTIIKPGQLGSLVINIGIRMLPDGGLDADPSYHLRTTQTNRYRLTTTSVSGETVHIANDSGSTSVVGFWVHGSYEATLSVSQGVDQPGENSNDEQLQVLKTLLAAWSWKV